MKNTVKYILKLLSITLITLAVGYSVAMLSFNLFGEMTTAQLRAVFGADFFALISAGGLAYHFYESRKIKEKRHADAEKRRRQRQESFEKEFFEINSILINSHNKVA